MCPGVRACQCPDTLDFNMMPKPHHTESVLPFWKYRDTLAHKKCLVLIRYTYWDRKFGMSEDSVMIAVNRSKDILPEWLRAMTCLARQNPLMLEYLPENGLTNFDLGEDYSHACED